MLLPQLLLEREAAVDTRDDDRATPLLRAVRRDEWAITGLLLAAGADANAADKDDVSRAKAGGAPALVLPCAGPAGQQPPAALK